MPEKSRSKACFFSTNALLFTMTISHTSSEQLSKKGTRTIIEIERLHSNAGLYKNHVIIPAVKENVSRSNFDSKYSKHKTF